MAFFLFAALVVFFCAPNALGNAQSKAITFSFDPHLSDIAMRRAKACSSHIAEEQYEQRGSLLELEYVRNYSLRDFAYSHELYAFDFFVESRQQNPYYVAKFEEAEFEYVPLLPLHWRTTQSRGCTYNSFIQDVLEMHRHITERDKSLTYRPPLKFSVLGTLNLRTVWGQGMPLQVRRGEAWHQVSQFIMSLHIGHYERWPECPDLLRKQFKYLVELPYPNYISSAEQKLSSGRSGEHDEERERRYMFAFIGSMELPGPEKACSTRNILYHAALLRDDVFFVNTTALHYYYSHNSLEESIFYRNRVTSILKQSIFCLILPGQSYSTHFFSLAISAGCVPIIISDWNALPFPHLLPYQTFTLRVYQQDFSHNPHFVLNYIKSSMTASLICEMRKNLAFYNRLLSYEKIEFNSNIYHSLQASDLFHSNIKHVPLSKGYFTVLPLENMLRELRYAQFPHVYYNNIPCNRYYFCENRRHIISERNNIGKAANMNDNSSFLSREYEQYDNRQQISNYHMLNEQFLNKHISYYTNLSSLSDVLQGVNSTNYITYSIPLERDNYQISGVAFQQLFKQYNVPNISPYLCQHNKRLIGMYKMVFFMQCVRVLFPLSPGKFKPHDRVDKINSSVFSYLDTIAGADTTIGLKFGVNNTRNGNVNSNMFNAYTMLGEGLSKEEYEYVLAFHNIRRDRYYFERQYPYHDPFRKGRLTGSNLFNIENMRRLGLT